MKNLYFFLLSLFALTSSSVYALDTITNLRVNPLAAVFNGLEAGFDVGVSDTVSVGADVGYVHDLSVLTGVKGSAKGVGLRLSHVPGGFHEDSFISLVGVHASRLDIKGDSKSHTNALKGEVSMGYRWVWDSGFNTSLTGGLAQVHVKNHELLGSGRAKGVTPTAELSFGYQI
ncbi:MAG: hypothetical protein HRU09_00995 [Oligoflexales bacterium]|nr:hypothetical protein [Oligoflexales bacterium]